MLGAEDRYDENTHKTSDFDTTMDFDVATTDKNNNNTWRTIYKTIGKRYFGDSKIPSREFIYLCKNNPNEPQNITTDIKKNKKIILEEILYAQVVRIHRKRMAQKKYNVGKPK